MFSSNASQVSNDVKYIEDVCSVYLRTGTGSSQTVTTGIKENTGALVISKSRSAATDWAWYDTFRGATYDLVSNSTAAQTTQSQGLTSFNTDGHTWGTLAKVNTSGATYVDTVLKPTPKFFDVVTYTGDGVAGRTVAHNLGSVPGCIIVKRTDADGNDWQVYHTSLGNTKRIYLNTSEVAATSTVWDNTTPTSTVFSVGTSSAVNASSATYVAYLFAHDAGGFGLTGTDNVISCGSFTCDGSGNATVSLGYEPQWLLRKSSNEVTNWELFDNMRGLSVTDNATKLLYPNLSNAEEDTSKAKPTATGFIAKGEISKTYIYIAIRRGPMKVPTSGTSVFKPTLTSATDGTAITTGFPSDSQWANYLSGDGNNTTTFDRLRGMSSTSGSSSANRTLFTSNTSAESSSFGVGYFTGMNNTGWVQGSYASGVSTVRYDFRRAPSFFDEVCYTGTGSTPQTIAHNLEVAPELMIIKGRSLASSSWIVYAQPIWGTGIGGFSGFDLFQLNNNGNAGGNNRQINETAPTASVFSVGYSGSTFPNTNNPSDTFVAYLFATCAGVSKIGKYTGTGTTLQIDCGFTSGARFVLIKRADSNGDWYVWDSARGIVSGNDPYLLLNSTAAETTGTDYIDTYSAGFEISSSAPSAINASGGTFIFLAIA